MNNIKMDAARGKSASKQNESIIARWCVEHLDLTPIQLLKALAMLPLLYLTIFLWTVI